MAAQLEVERKFLLRSDAWRGANRATRIRQGYLCTDPARVVRVRLRDGAGTMTVKGKGTVVRREIEFSIAADDAEALLDLCVGFVVEKTRHERRVGDALWEIDVFEGENAGLVVAELEAASESELEALLVKKPDWLGRDVTADARLTNAQLAQRPFSHWTADERAALLASF